MTPSLSPVKQIVWETIRVSGVAKELFALVEQEAFVLSHPIRRVRFDSDGKFELDREVFVHLHRLCNQIEAEFPHVELVCSFGKVEKAMPPASVKVR